jgi:cation transport regulator ChaB
MPKADRAGRPVEDELPGTLQRSDDKAQRTFAKAHDSALDSYDGDEQRAHRVGYAALKHTHEKVGDHWSRSRGGAGLVPLGLDVGHASGLRQVRPR